MSDIKVIPINIDTQDDSNKKQIEVAHKTQVLTQCPLIGVGGFEVEYLNQPGQRLNNVDFIEEKVDMRKTGFAGRAFYDESQDEIVKFEKVQEIRHHDILGLLHTMSFCDKENLIIPELKWVDGRTKIKKNIRKILQEIIDLNTVEECLKEYIIRNIGVGIAKTNLRTFRRGSGIIVDTEKRSKIREFNNGNLLETSPWLGFSEAMIDGKWINFNIHNRESRKISMSICAENGLTNEDGNLHKGIYNNYGTLSFELTKEILNQVEKNTDLADDIIEDMEKDTNVYSTSRTRDKLVSALTGKLLTRYVEAEDNKDIYRFRFDTGVNPENIEYRDEENLVAAIL